MEKIVQRIWDSKRKENYYVVSDEQGNVLIESTSEIPVLQELFDNVDIVYVKEVKEIS